RTLIATSRLKRSSRARYTSPIPPAPSGERISYGPSRLPIGRVKTCGLYGGGGRSGGAPGSGDGEERTIELRDGSGAEALQGACQVFLEDREGARDSGFAERRQGVRVGAANENRAGAEAERLGDVASAAHSSVHQDLGAAADRLDDFRQRAKRRRDAVQLPPAVVGNEHRPPA